MPIQFLPQQQNPMWSGLGDILGLLGGGTLGYGLGQHRQSQTVQSLKGLGISEQEANIISKLPPQLQAQFIKEKMKEKEARRQTEIASSILNPQATFGIPYGTNVQQVLGNLGEQQQMPAQPMQQPGYEQRIQSALAGGLNPQLLNTVERSAAHVEKQAQREKELASKERTEAYKITSPVRAEITKQAENADNLVDVMKEQKKISDSGKMDNELYVAAIDKFMPFEALKSPETQAFQSLEKEFLKDLKSIFGGKITDREMDTFLRSIPKATNSPEARKMIIDRLDAYYKAKQLKFKVMRQIIKENNGIPPLDLQERIQEKTASKEKEYANRFLGVPKGASLVQNERTGQRGYRLNGKTTPLD
jgi:hypothetical protein